MLQAMQAQSTDHLAPLVGGPAGVYGALPLVASHHLGLRGAAPWRRGGVTTANGHVFPHPADVQDLIDGLFGCLERLFAHARDADDEMAVAALGAWGVVALHPFENANGRTAIDFAHLLVMARLGVTSPVLVLPTDVQRMFGPFFMTFDAAHALANTAADAASLAALAGRFDALFRTIRVEDLALSELRHVAVALRAAVSPPRKRNR